MPKSMKDLQKFAAESREIGVDMVHFAWIGDIDDEHGRQFDGVRTSIELTRVPWNRTVYWCESRNKRRVETIMFKINPDIWVMSMKDLFRAWSVDENVLAGTARHVYTSLKRLEAFSAAKDLASLCILRTVGGYFFDASVRFADDLNFFRFINKPLPKNWTTSNPMPVRKQACWCQDAWALYTLPFTDNTKKALNSYLVGASQAGINHRKGISPGFYKPVMELKFKRDMVRYQYLFTSDFLGKQEELRTRSDRVGLIQDLIILALNEGWGGSDEFNQVDIDTGETPILTLPEFGLLKIPGSSTVEWDPSKWTGWKAKGFRDWSTKRL